MKKQAEDISKKYDFFDDDEDDDKSISQMIFQLNKKVISRQCFNETRKC